MTKNTWKNIYNFDSSDSAFDFNDIASSISETTKSENVIKRNILIGGTEAEYETVPLILSSNLDQSGGNQEELISTEQLENKLRDIFTGLDEPQQGGNIENSASEFSTENIDTVITETLQDGGDCGGEHEHPEDVIVNVPLQSQIGGELTIDEKEDIINMHQETQELINAGNDAITSLISSESRKIQKEIQEVVKLQVEHQADNIQMNKETQELITASNDVVLESIPVTKGGDCGGEHDSDEKCHHDTVPLTLNL